MEDKWLVACMELWFAPPINSKFICTISFIPSTTTTTTSLLRVRENIEEIYVFYLVHK